MKVKGGLAAGLELGNLGFKVKGVSAQQIIDDSEYFTEILIKNKAIGFKKVFPTASENEEILRKLYRGDNPFDSLVPGMLLDQCHAGNKFVESKEVENFIQSQWHIDNPFLESVPSFTSMHMRVFDCPPQTGQTHLISLTNLYRDCPKAFKDKLETARLLPLTGSQNEDVPSHPALRTHPVTGETMLFWSGCDTRLEGGSEPWFEELSKWVRSQMANQAIRYTWDWSVGDLLIWDNRAVMHALSPGWSHEQRVFDRGEVGTEKPYYAPNKVFSVNEEFGDTYRVDSLERDKSSGPNPDHIPLVFTKGIYGLQPLEKFFQKVTLFVYTQDNSLPQDVVSFVGKVGETELFNAVAVIPDSENDFFKRYRIPEADLIGQKFLFRRNGDLDKAYAPDYDILTETLESDGRWPPLLVAQSVIEIHPDLRHAGHAWHYPDWFPHQQLKYRPWDWRNLPFIEYIDLQDQEHPSEDFLVQYAVDTVYGCFNHLEKNEDRKQIIERIVDYLSYMIELGEHESDR